LGSGRKLPLAQLSGLEPKARADSKESAPFLRRQGAALDPPEGCTLWTPALLPLRLVSTLRVLSDRRKGIRGGFQSPFKGKTPPFGLDSSGF
jgi:hypothetical protein